MKSVKNSSKWWYYLGLLPVTFGICAWQTWSWWSWALSSPNSDQQELNQTEKTVQINIPLGTAAQHIGRDLEAEGLIRSAKAWKLWAKWLATQNPEGGFQAGTYEISFNDSLPEIASQIWQGRVMQRSFTIPEGWSIKQMGRYFESLGFFTEEEFTASARQIPREKYPWLPKNLPHLEGFLYPNTYKVPVGNVTPQQVIAMMLNQFERVSLPMYQKAKQQTNLNLLEWVTLASIVEKEAAIAQERDRIAGVFTQRLKKGMKLQTDPTVEYGLGIKQTADRPLTYAEVATASPYNTYIHPGLPPTPIASPGAASLKAALYPEKTDLLFFVARYDGTHIFSKTYSQHLAATRQIRRQWQARK